MHLNAWFRNLFRNDRLNSESSRALVRRQLALIILRHVDRGEHDPIRLSEIAHRELACLHGPAQIAVSSGACTIFFIDPCPTRQPGSEGRAHACANLFC
jgi:hypothetical protein